jgi:16S rRNA (guanine527-N7)-methyltransferase
MDEKALVVECAGLGIALPVDRGAEFARFEEAIYRTNSVMNLTRVPKAECRLRHFVDSLLFHDLVPIDSTVLDIGTGPGFPAWPLACARPDLRVTALDSSGKMLGFLRSQVLPNLDCVETRAEEWGVRERFDVVTGRALAPLAVQLEISVAPCRVGGLIIPMRTTADLPALESLNVKGLCLRLRDVVKRVLPGIDAERVFPVYEKTAETPRKYPRSWADIKRAPWGS